MKAKEIRELTTVEMPDQEKQLKKELFSFRPQLATGQPESAARIRGVRKSTARIKTVLYERAR